TFATVATLAVATAVHGITTTGASGAAILFSTETGKGLTMQVGDTADDFNKVTVSVNDMSSAGLGLSGLDLGTQEAAAGSLEKIKGAVGLVSGARSTLGSLQNRLDHTINNLGVTSENMTAAESRIRDVDMAKEMMDFTKNNVLTQAAQAMLSQANQQPQQVLQLLR
ncbi:MAG: flagellin, partial [Hydrogenoanaerobacterium sp.]